MPVAFDVACSLSLAIVQYLVEFSVVQTAKNLETGEEIVITDPEELEEEPTPAEQDYELTLNNWLADLGGDTSAAISVYRYDEKTNRPSFVDSMAAQDMDGVTLFKTLKEEYGGGKFRIQLRADGRIVKTQTLQIEPPPKSKQIQPGSLGNDLPALIRELKSDSGGGDIRLMMEMMQQQNTQFQTMMVEMVKAMGANNNQQPAFDPVAMQTSMLQGIETMQKLATPVDPTSLILKGIELVSAVKGDTGDGGNANMFSLMQSAIKEFGGTLSDAVKVMPPQPGQAPDNPTPPIARLREPVAGDEPASSQPGALAQPETVSRNTVPDQLKQFEPYVNKLVALAVASKDPDLYGEVIIDELGDEYALSWIGEKQGRETLMEIFTQTQPYREWFESVGKVIKDILGFVEPSPDVPNEHVDDPVPLPDNAGEPSATDGVDASSGQSGGSGPDPDDPSVDGSANGTGGGAGHVTLDGATGQPIENQPANP